jgi:hypothetical protein
LQEASCAHSRTGIQWGLFGDVCGAQPLLVGCDRDNVTWLVLGGGLHVKINDI